jgi:DNA-binding Lrp family transcriptional regulator
MVNMPLKSATILVLNLLYKDHQESLTRLSDALGDVQQRLSRQSIGKYISQLEAEKKIVYSIIENPNVHEFRTFFIEIKTNPEEPEIVSRLQQLAHVRTIDGIIGQNSLIVKFCTRNDQQFSKILEQVDHLITGTRFQHYKIINIIKSYKDGGMYLAPPDTSDVEGNNKGFKIDAVDERLLDIMQDMPVQFSSEELAKQVSSGYAPLSDSQVYRRVHRMKAENVIKAYTIKFSPILIPQTDFPLKFYLQILPKRLSEYDAIAVETLAPKDEIVELYRTGEEYGLLGVARTGSIDGYRQFLESLYKTGKIQDTISTLVIDEKLPAIFKPFKDISPAVIL